MAVQKINFNGKLLNADLPLLTSGNRGFKYGDGLFETIRVFDGKIPFLELHFDRLKRGMRLLKMDIPDHYSAAFFENEIQKLTFGNGNHRIRLTVFRSNGGHYYPEDNCPQFLIECGLLNDSKFNLNSKGLQLGLFSEIELAKNYLSTLKTCNSLPYILAAIYCKENGFDDCFLSNSSGNVAECTSSNVFLVTGKTFLTPALTEGCVEGTMRRIIFEIAEKADFKIEATVIKVSDLKQADEIWLSNAIQGIRWAEKFDEHHFTNKTARQFVQLLNEKIKSK